MSAIEELRSATAEQTVEESSSTPMPAFRFRPECEESRWQGTLQIAAITAMCADGFPNNWRGGCTLLTAWSAGVGDYAELQAQEPDAEKHKLYASHMIQGVVQELPWLISVLDVAGATLVVGPDYCAFSVPGIEAMYPIPQLIPYTKLLPWNTGTEKDLPN